MKLNSERLKSFRYYKGWTIEEAAKQLEITKQAFSKYENGTSVPSTDVLERMVTRFQISVSYLTKPEPEIWEESPVFYRKQARTPQRELNRAKVLTRFGYEILEVMGEQSEPDLDVPEGLSVEESAQWIRTRWKLGEKPVGDMASLLGVHGISVFWAELQNNSIDGYSQVINGCPIVMMNYKKGTFYRQNFSLAHELGHLALHRHMDKRLEQDRMEQEANMFAAAFLMPRAAFCKRMIRKDLPYFMELKKTWNVSAKAIIHRAGELGLLGGDAECNKAKASQLFQKLNGLMKGYMEPGDEEIERGQATVTERLMQIMGDAQERACFLEELCFPKDVLKMLGGLSDSVLDPLFSYVEDKAENIDYVQLSLQF